MMKQQTDKLIFLMLALVLTACGNEATQTVEATYLAPQTTATLVAQTTLTATSEPTALATTEPQSTLDTGYYDGIIVITQYYTFLGHGLHEEAYWLLSVSAQRPHSFEEYVANTRKAFKTVEIVSIVPFYVEVIQQGGHMITQDSNDRKRFAVRIRAWGEGNMSGSAMNGDLQTLFLILVQEDGKWKIDTFSTAPLP